MSLSQAIEHIRTVEQCGLLRAQVELKTEIGNGMIPAKWANARGPRDRPNISKLCGSQLLLCGSGYAPWGPVIAPLFGQALRPLLLLRSAVKGIWPRNKSSAPQYAATRKDAPSPESEQLAAQWMTLVESIDYIRLQEICDSVDALKHLKNEMRDGMVRVRWGDAKDAADVPNPVELQESELLLVGTGFAPDGSRKEYRMLLIRRDDVQKIWDLRTDDEPGESNHAPSLINSHPASESGALDRATLARRSGRPSDAQVIRDTLAAMHAEGYSLHQPQQVLVDQIRSRNGKDPDSPGWSDRTIKQHVSAWLRQNGITPPRMRK